MTTAYSIYSKKQNVLRKTNPFNDLFQPLPNKQYDIIYCDPPWDYGGKLQYDKSVIKSENKNFEKEIFLSSAEFKYPTVKLKDLMTLNVQSISKENCLLFMWTTAPHMENAIKLGNAWGFDYKTVAFMWDKQIHNPGHYTLSQTEFVLVFKKGKFPSPRGARNIKQLVSVKRTTHSTKPDEVMKCIEQMFPTQEKIELFARKKVIGWDSWGLEI